jgi:hypothetical protein
MSDRKIRIALSAIIFFLMGLMGANIVVRVMNQRQNVPIESLQEHVPFGTSDKFFTPEEFRKQEEIYRGRIDDAPSSTPLR